eukprot:Pgem_evm2s1952
MKTKAMMKTPIINILENIIEYLESNDINLQRSQFNITERNDNLIYKFSILNFVNGKEDFVHILLNGLIKNFNRFSENNIFLNDSTCCAIERILVTLLQIYPDLTLPYFSTTNLKTLIRKYREKFLILFDKLPTIFKNSLEDLCCNQISKWKYIDYLIDAQK